MIAMNKMLLKPALAAALLASAAVGIAPAFAQTTTPPATTAPAQPQRGHRAEHRLMPGQLVEGRIAFLKAELKITPAQETQWQNVAGAMRDNARALDQAIQQARQNRGPETAVQRIAMRESFSKLRAESDARLLAAFQPLYDGFSPEQKQLADQLMAPHHHGWHHKA